MFDSNGKLIIPTLLENQETYQKAYQGTFGLVDVAPSSALGSDLAITAEMKKISDEFTQHAFIQNSPLEATETGLDNLCFLRGIKRKTDEHSVCLVEFSGADDTVIEKGTLVTNASTGEVFATNERGLITGSVFLVFATSVNAGRIVCNANTLTGTDLENVTVTNPNDGILGFLIESDTDLRKRLLEFTNGLNVDEELYLKLRDLHNVKYVNIISNPELATDANNIPAKSTSIVVLGGDSKVIASEIFKAIPADKKTTGTISEVIASTISQKEYIINFSRPETVNTTMSVNITKDSSFDPDDLGVIRESILNYFADKFTISNDVLIDSLYIPVQQNYNDNYSSFKGVVKVAITLNGASDNVSIDYNQYATLSSENLLIVVL